MVGATQSFLPSPNSGSNRFKQGPGAAFDKSIDELSGPSTLHPSEQVRNRIGQENSRNGQSIFGTGFTQWVPSNGEAVIFLSS